MTGAILVYGENDRALEWMKKQYDYVNLHFTNRHKKRNIYPAHGIKAISTNDLRRDIAKQADVKYFWQIDAHYSDRHLTQTKKDLEIILSGQAPKGVELVVRPVPGHTKCPMDID